MRAIEAEPVTPPEITAGQARNQPRPDWETWFVAICGISGSEVVDPSTKHGCVVVDDDHTILSVGYNSPPRGCQDDAIPTTRPEKYPDFVHAEENAIANAARTGVSLKALRPLSPAIPVQPVCG